MIPNLATSRQTLLSKVALLLSNQSFLDSISSQKISSFVAYNALYWNLGFNQGYVVVDIDSYSVYRVFEIDKNKEQLSQNTLCDPAVAQLVLSDIESVLSRLNALLEDHSPQAVSSYLSPYLT